MPERSSSRPPLRAGKRSVESASPLESMVTALQQLLDAQDTPAVRQSIRFEEALGAFHRHAADLNRAGQDLRSILDSMSDGVVVADEHGSFLEFNPAAERILGLGRRDVPPEQWAREYGIYLPDRRSLYPTDELPLVRAIRGEDVERERLYVCRPGSEEGRWISVNASALRDQTGAIRGGVAMFRDITKQVASERALQRLSSAVQETDDPVFMTDREGKFIYVNPAFERVTGYSHDDVKGKTPRILKSGEHDAAFYERMWDTILAGRVYRGSTVNRKKSGEVFYAEQTITPIKDVGGEVDYFVALVKDMTERRLAEAQEAELKLATIVQKKLYPASAPAIANCEIAGAVFPATDLCGDCFDYIAMRDGALGIVLGDVSGHGLGPAFIMAETRAYLHSLTGELEGLGPIFSRINDLLVRDLPDSSYVALIMVELDPVRRCLRYCNAGHTAGYLLSGSGEVKFVLTSTGMPLGLFADRLYACSDEVALDPDDVLLLITDGVTESGIDYDSLFGDERALEIVREHRNESSQTIIERIHEAARAFAGDVAQHDDMTLVVCKFR